MQEPLPYTHLESHLNSSIHHFYINEVIIEPQFYTEMIHVIRYSSEYDTIFIHLNTVGGNAFTTIQLIQAMRESSAHIVTSMEGQCCSAGTMIFLSGKEYIVQPHSLMMIHNYSSGVSGKGHEQRAQFEAFEKLFRELMAEMYAHFLTDDEIQKVIDGSDFWFDSKEVISRLKHMIEVRQDEEEQAALHQIEEAEQIAYEQAEEIVRQRQVNQSQEEIVTATKQSKAKSSRSKKK